MRETLQTATQRRQFALTRYLRDPDQAPAPTGAEQRRLSIYRELIFNNIEGFLSSGFPVLRSLLTEADWLALARAFVRDYRAQSPYFLEIGQEFFQFVQQQPELSLPPFAVELMHYEWVELALDVAPASLPAVRLRQPVSLATPLLLSELAWPLAYQYPVHQIGPQNQPTEVPAQATCLVVHRDRQHRVRFMVLSAMSYALLEACGNGQPVTLGSLTDTFGTQFSQLPSAQFAAQLNAMVQHFVDSDILLVCETP